MADNPLWQFSLDFYRRTGVEPACLTLQDRYGLDVNLVLLCCWLGVAGRRLDPQAIAVINADGVLWQWRERVVLPLRAVRRSLKLMTGAGAGALYDDVARLELAAEAAEQQIVYELLDGTVETGVGSTDTVYDNLMAYIEAVGVRAAFGPCRVLADIAATVSMVSSGSALRR